VHVHQGITMKNQSVSRFVMRAAALLPASAFLVSIVTLQGKVTSQTWSINSNTNAIVMMPTFPLSCLYTTSKVTIAAGKNAGLTPFTISVIGFTSSSSALTIYPEFLGTSVDATTYALSNPSCSNAVTGVGIALYSVAEGKNQINLNSVTRGAALPLAANATSASAKTSAKDMATRIIMKIKKHLCRSGWGRNMWDIRNITADC